YVLTDALGSTIALTDVAGAIVTSYTYEPFGKATTSGAANGNTQLFTGRELDSTGLQYSRARYLHPTFGRFISEDPFGIGASGPNLYAYASNDPVNSCDPNGTIPPLVIACGVGALFNVGID